MKVTAAACERGGLEGDGGGLEAPVVVAVVVAGFDGGRFVAAFAVLDAIPGRGK